MTAEPSRARTEIPWSAWAVHFYTATGAVMAFLAAREVFAGDFRMAFIWLFAALVVDSSDGTLARLAHVHGRLPHFSGEKVDDLVDYLTFVFVPALIVWRADLIPAGWGLAVVAAMLLSSAYGFASADAKTADCFFTGFPSYWNVAALYLLIGRLPASLNAAILLALAALVFVRIGYVYPSRTPTLRPLTVTLTAVWGALILAIIVSLPNPSRVLVWLSLLFPVYYAVLSLALDVRRKSMPTRVLSLALVGLLLWPAAASTQTRLTENVVLVTLDGARWQDVFTGMDESLLRASVASGTDITTLPAYKQFSGATPLERRERLMPFLWRTLLVDRGFIAGDRTAGSLVSVTNRHRFSYPGYSEILTGQAHDDAIKSNDAIRNPFPSVLQFVRRKLQLAAAHVATFGSWGVFRAIVESEEGATTVNAGVQAYVSPSPEMQALSAIQSQATPPWDNLRHDAFTFRFAMDYMKRVRPRVLYIAFDETDDWAHDGRYDLVLQALHRTDGYLQELWEALQADPQYRDKTTLIITTDHGRGRTTADWRKHGSDVAGADEIWIAVASPDTTRRGVWRGHPPLFQNQIAATIASALGLDYREHNPQAGLALGLAASAPRPADMKLGIVGTDTSHVVAFTRLLNDPSSPDHIPGARIVAAYKGGSPDLASSRDRIDGFTRELQEKFGVEIVGTIAELCKRVDAVLLESVDGRSHLAQAREVISAGKPLFVDKPLAATLDDAREIARLAKHAGVAWFSTSSLRYAVANLKTANLSGADVWGPGPLEEHHQLDLSWYAIHEAEMLYTLMGTGCEEVTRIPSSDADVVACRWKDGRIGTMRALRPSSSYGAVVFRKDAKGQTSEISTPPSSYMPLLREIVRFFETRVPPVSNDETLELFAFLDAAQRSKDAGGKPMRLR